MGRDCLGHCTAAGRAHGAQGSSGAIMDPCGLATNRGRVLDPYSEQAGGGGLGKKPGWQLPMFPVLEE
jgi:hypothetical protein